MPDQILLGYRVPNGTEKHIRVFHTVITGQTQYSGKTTTIKTMATEAAELGYKVLIFDTKELTEDYRGFGQDIPIVVRDTLDSLELLGLIESIMNAKLKGYYSVLSELCIGGPNVKQKGKANSLQEIADRAFYLSEHGRGFVQGAARTIWDLLVRLIEQTRGMKTVTRLQLKEGINRMPINDLKAESQQVVVATAIEDILRIYKRKVILVIDEAFKIIPQEGGSAALWAINRYITQGAGTGVFMVISTQFLALTNKDPLKACPVKILGTQDHITEQNHTLDLAGREAHLTADKIVRLKVGHFFVITKEEPDAELVYVKPYNMPVELAQKIARGEEAVTVAVPVVLNIPLVKPPTETLEDWTDVILRIQKLEATVAASSGA